MTSNRPSGSDVVADVTPYHAGISAIDTHYVRPHLDASHLIVQAGRAAFVDTGTSHSVPLLLAALEAAGRSVDEVDYVFVTHVHLDHAGGAGQLIAACPNAVAVLHPRGAPHLADPAKLEAGSRAVYGDELFERLYGEIRPIPEARIRTVADEEQIDWAGRHLRFIHTEGHARHHYCMEDPASDGVFTGDSFGLSYRELDTAAGHFLFPTTTPVHFDPEAAHASVDRILSFEPDWVFLTHYGRVPDPAGLAGQLHGDLDAFVAMAERAAGETDVTKALTEAMTAYLFARLDRHGFDPDPVRRMELLGPDIQLNVQGLEVWLARRSRG
jgi:glyoxylase-like metal-dependent hydrolase (beta-lactamase superfamily II)